MKKSIFKYLLFVVFLLPNYLMAQPANNWWNQSVFYELFVRSFYDSNGNGIGDFNGITAKLDYLNDGDSTTNTDLGVKGIWLMPINSSPSYHGYDVTNYKAVNAQYGTTAEFKNMVSEAHKRGIKIIIDFVINHSSSQHPWFIKSAANDPFYRDFYRWNTTKPTYKGPWGQEVWYTKNSSNYYALFWSEMPDLNYNYQPVKDSIFDAAKYWIDSMNIDGFRLDAAMYLYENGSNTMNQPETHQFWSDFNNYCKSLKPSFMTVGEVWDATSNVKAYNNKLDNCFEFDLSFAMVNAMKTSNTQKLRTEILYANDNLQFNKFSTFLTNHDQNRVFDELGGNISKLKTAAAIYLTLPGTPYLYYGEEIGMKGSKPDETIRSPMQWTTGTNAGFSNVNPWLSLNTNYSSYNVQLMQADTNSLLSYYKKLIKIRNKYQALTIGTYQNIICTDTAVFSFLRVHNNQTFLVIINTANRNANGLYLSLNSLNWNNGLFAAKNVLNNSTDFISIADNVGTGISLQPFEAKVIQLDKSTGIKEIKDKTNFTIYSNPSKEKITVLLTGLQLKASYNVQIIDTAGELKLTAKILSNEENVINIEHLSKGIYFVKLDNGIIKKFIKE